MQTAEYFQKYHQENREYRLLNGSRRYYIAMSDPDTARKYKDYKNHYQRDRYNNDPNWREKSRLKKKLSRIIRLSGYYDSVVLDLVGCTRSSLISHLESQFKTGMTWNNYGILGWVVDHKKPCCQFDLTDSKQRKSCFHYTNLQPLWYEENRRKSFVYAAKAH